MRAQSALTIGAAPDGEGFLRSASGRSSRRTGKGGGGVTKSIEDEIADQAILSAASAPPRALALDEALRLTCGDRNRAYGEPVGNMQHIADIFNAITGRDLSAREIALVHQATKLARRARNTLHRDSYVDGMAYAGIEYECALAEAGGLKPADSSSAG